MSASITSCTVGTCLFDLDGTLVDTAPALARALNQQRQNHQLLPLPYAAIRSVASHGTAGLLKLGFDITPASPEFIALQTEYLALYANILDYRAYLFDGIAYVLQMLEKKQITWGVVTNKHRRFTLPILQAVRLSPMCIVCGDDVPQPKPSPQSLLLACRQLDIPPSTCCYVGDAERDIMAGKAAGMRTLVALYGYMADDDMPASWQADALLNTPNELLTYLSFKAIPT